MSSSNNTPESELASIRQELNELRQTVVAMRSNGHRNGNGSSVLEDVESTALTDRRSMLKKVGALAAGVAAVGLLRPTTSKASIADKTTPGINPDGGNFILGQSNNAASQTILINTTTALITGHSLSGQNYGNVAFANPATTSIGLVGYTNTAGATGGAANQLVGVYGQAVGGTNPTGVFGTGGAIGVSGSGPVGVLGTGSGGGCGVDGTIGGTSTVAFGVRGLSTAGAGGAFAGGRSAVSLFTGAGAIANPNTTIPGGGSVGDIYRGSTNGSLWYHTGAASNPYKRLSDATSAGQLTLLATPVRYVDSRNGTGGATGAFAPGEVRQYNFTTLQAGTIPAGATGIIGNIAAVSPNTTGNMQINTANSFPAGSAAVINFNPGQDIANHFASAISAAGLLFVKANPNGGSVQLVIDIYGYYL
jgi:hypothetical protein